MHGPPSGHVQDLQSQVPPSNGGELSENETIGALGVTVSGSPTQQLLLYNFFLLLFTPFALLVYFLTLALLGKVCRSNTLYTEARLYVILSILSISSILVFIYPFALLLSLLYCCADLNFS